MSDSGSSTSSSFSPATTSKTLFNKYELGRLLGFGATAKVFLARHLHSSHTVAVKVFANPRRSSSPNSPVLREISSLRRLHHPHILRLYEVLATRSKIYLVVELAKGGELFSRISNSGRFSEDQARRIFQQLIAAVAFAHSRGVFHRDIKPENLLLDDQGNLKVSDFGLSSVGNDRGVLHTLCGTPAYVAPEILCRKGYRGGPADLWSCGVVLYVLVVGYLPFNDTNLMAMYRKICLGRVRFPRWVSMELRRLLGRLLDTNPDARISVEGVLHDPWFVRGLDREKWGEMMRSGCGEKLAAPPWEFTEGNGGDCVDGVYRELNAFDLISFSASLDLSGLVDEKVEREFFSWTGAGEGALDRVEEIGRQEGLVVRRKGKEVSEALIEGINGNFIARIAVHRFSGNVIVAEVEKCVRCGNFWMEKLRKVLDEVKS